MRLNFYNWTFFCNFYPKEEDDETTKSIQGREKMKNAKRLLLPLLAALVFLPLLSHAQEPARYRFRIENAAQEAPVGVTLDKPFIITVEDAKGKPVPNLRVEAEVVNQVGGAKVDKTLQYTDRNGKAKILFTNGSKTSLYKIHAKVFEPTGFKPLKEYMLKSMAYSIIDIIFYVVGGLALFLYGMKLLSDGLQSSVGEKMKSVLAFLSKNKYMGLLLGFVVTAVLQSSSVTTVMLIGFVNAGIMAFAQTIGVIMGANIGTTVTGFIISLKASQLIFPFVILGFLLNFLGKSNRIKFIGQIFMGLGMIFLGLETMASHVKPLKDSVTVSQIFVNFSTSPVLAILAGMAVTFMIQSSSATLGLIITLGLAGLLDVHGAFGLVLGSNIGTTITAQLAAIGANRNAKRVALLHSMFNIFGVMIMLILIYTGLIDYFYKFTAGIIDIFSSTKITMSTHGGDLVIPVKFMPIFIAFMHALFNIGNTIIMLPLSGVLCRTAQAIIPYRKDEKKKFQYLEPHLLETPALALTQVTTELTYMLTTARKLIRASSRGLFDEEKDWFRKFQKRENRVDSLQKEITEYLVKLTQRQMTEHEAVVIPKLIHAVNDVERIGDLSENIVEIAMECKEKDIFFSEDGKKELLEMQAKIEEMTDETLRALNSFEAAKAIKVLDIEKEINAMEARSRQAHIDRLQQGTCTVVTGIHFVEIISNLERIGDHLANIARVVYYSDPHNTRANEKV